MQQAGLSSGVGVDSQSVIVFPVDMQASGHSHEVGGTIRPALIALRLVLGGIPAVSSLAAFGTEGNTRVVPLVRNTHAKAPVFGDDRHPVSGEVDWSGGGARPPRR